MRQVVLDTETTGLEPDQGHRIIEIGGVELVNRRRTGHTFHRYLNPEREIDAAAHEVHGISSDFLADKPRFSEVVRELLEFINDAELVIHNAAFDVGFLDYELANVGHERRVTDYCTVLDTLLMARRLHPGQRNSLDALCKRYAVDNSDRELHGALLDARILADVYLAMTGGQASLSLDTLGESAGFGPPGGTARREVERADLKLIVLRPTQEELAAHAARLNAIDTESGGRCLWKQLQSPDLP